MFFNKKPTIPFLFDCVLPNMILPNALLAEFAVINFITSKYNTEQIFHLEQATRYDNTIGGYLFNNHLGQLPNSTTNRHHTAPAYSKEFDIVEESVFFGRQKYKKYIYPIGVSPHLDKFVGSNNHGSRLNGAHFWKNISETVLKDVRERRAFILLDHAEENFISKNEYEQLHSAIVTSGLPKEQIILGFNTFNGEQLYQSWFSEDERKMTVKNWPFVIANTSTHYSYNTDQHVSLDWFKQSKNTIREHHFLFKIRRPRDHRLALLAKLASDDLLQYADWSCLTPVKLIYHYDLLMHEYKVNINSDKVNQLDTMIPHKLKSESSADYNDVSAWTDQHPEAYKNSYFYVCTETFMDNEHKSLTEKVFKPIVNLQPFVFVAYPGALKQLKSLGFKTFSPFIDESYDDEPDKSKRLNMICDEVKRLATMPIEELHDWYWKMEDILIHNQKHLLNIHKDKSITQEFFNYLYNELQK